MSGVPSELIQRINNGDLESFAITELEDNVRNNTPNNNKSSSSSSSIITQTNLTLFSLRWDTGIGAKGQTE